MTFDLILKNFTTWAQTVDAIRGAVIIGSQARSEQPADQWSDLDLLVFTTDPTFFISTDDWLDEIGKYHLSFFENTIGGGLERRVLFENMLDVDFLYLSTEVLSTLQQDDTAKDMIRRGARVVLDKDGTLTHALESIESIVPAKAQLPDEKTFLNMVNDFWYHTVWTAKKLRRGELWTAKGCVDNYLKWHCVLSMMTWHAHAIHGTQYNTWMNGRFLEKWADPLVVEELKDAFGHYDAHDLWRALHITMDLFQRIASETANHLNYSYPTDEVDRIMDWVHNCFMEWEKESERPRNHNQ